MAKKVIQSRKASKTKNLKVSNKAKTKATKNNKIVKKTVTKTSKTKPNTITKAVKGKKSNVPVKPLRATKAANKKLTKTKTVVLKSETETKLIKKASKKENIISKEPSKKEEKTSIITKDEDGNEIIDMTKIKDKAPVLGINDVLLKCVKQGSKLRVRIMSPGYYNDANCQFPKDIRKEGRLFKVNVKEVVLAEGSAGRYFYRIKSGIQILDGTSLDESITKVKIFEDKTENDCAVCLCSPKSTVIVPCGHFYTCKDCATKLDKCPICRGGIAKLIDKTNMD